MCPALSQILHSWVRPDSVWRGRVGLNCWLRTLIPIVFYTWDAAVAKSGARPRILPVNTAVLGRLCSWRPVWSVGWCGNVLAPHPPSRTGLCLNPGARRRLHWLPWWHPSFPCLRRTQCRHQSPSCLPLALTGWRTTGGDWRQTWLSCQILCTNSGGSFSPRRGSKPTLRGVGKLSGGGWQNRWHRWLGLHPRCCRPPHPLLYLCSRCLRQCPRQRTCSGLLTRQGSPPRAGDCRQLSGRNPSTRSGHLTRLAIPQHGGGGDPILASQHLQSSGHIHSQQLCRRCVLWTRLWRGGVGHRGGGPESTTVCISSITPATTQAVTCLRPPPLPGGDSSSGWLQSLASALQSALCPTPEEACVTSPDVTKDVAAQLGPGSVDAPPPGRGGGDDPPCPSFDGPRDAHGGQCLPTGITVTDFPPELHLQGGPWDLVVVPITLAVVLFIRVRSVWLQVAFPLPLTGMCMGLSVAGCVFLLWGSGLKSLVASGTTASGSRIDPLVHPEWTG